jgi:hypothetical protein
MRPSSIKKVSARSHYTTQFGHLLAVQT